jgi:hypothetical protein
MIALIWAVFYLLNVVLLLVVLLNFLIAIVSETYFMTMKESQNFIFFFRSELNQEYIKIFGENTYSGAFNQILLMTSPNDQKDENISD